AGALIDVLVLAAERSATRAVCVGGELDVGRHCRANPRAGLDAAADVAAGAGAITTSAGARISPTGGAASAAVVPVVADVDAQAAAGEATVACLGPGVVAAWLSGSATRRAHGREPAAAANQTRPAIAPRTALLARCAAGAAAGARADDER